MVKIQTQCSKFMAVPQWVWGRQLFKRTWKFYIIFALAYVYYQYILAGGPTTFLDAIWMCWTCQTWNCPSKLAFSSASMTGGPRHYVIFRSLIVATWGPYSLKPRRNVFYSDTDITKAFWDLYQTSRYQRTSKHAENQSSTSPLKALPDLIVFNFTIKIPIEGLSLHGQTFCIAGLLRNPQKICRFLCS